MLTDARKILIDHRACGGSGCKACRNRGVAYVRPRTPAGLTLPNDPQGFEVARQECPCYQGISINADVTQCSHPQSRSDYCSLDDCPALLPKEKP